MTTSKVTTRNDLAWLAGCYVAGELSVDETAAFEARLETDVAACDAVAKAMELNLAIAAAFDSRPSVISPRPSATPPSRWAGAAITAIAATAVVAATVALMIGRGSATNGLARKDGADRLVAAWASGEAARNSADEEESIDSAGDADLDPPDWMLAAISVEDVNEKLPGSDKVREN